MASYESAHMPALVGFVPVPGVTMRPIFGEGSMINYIEIAAGATVPMHSHPHEQLGYVVTGTIVMVIDGDESELRPGDGYRIAGDVQHSGTAGADGCVVIDIFTPVREDYRELAAQARRDA